MSGPTDDRDVGYGKPPREHRWKCGQSGNPRGRPRRFKRPPPNGIKEALAQAFSADTLVVRGGRKITVPRYEAWAEQLARESHSVSTKEKLAILTVLDRMGVVDRIGITREEDEQAKWDREHDALRAMFEQIKSELQMD